MPGFGPLKGTGTILLTTYKRDGTPVPTPVSIAFDGDRAFFRSYDQAWKTKRLRQQYARRDCARHAAGQADGPGGGGAGDPAHRGRRPSSPRRPWPAGTGCCRRSWCHSHTGSSTTRRCITNSNGPTDRRRTADDGHRRRSVALVTFAMMAANGGIASATSEMMTEARTE